MHDDDTIFTHVDKMPFRSEDDVSLSSKLWRGITFHTFRRPRDPFGLFVLGRLALPRRDSTAREQRRPAIDVLVVCTGNICRSPYVASFLQDALPDLRVVSAGTVAVVGRGPVSPVIAALERLDRPTPPMARQLRRSMVRDARLVLTMTRAHRGSVIELVPKASGRTFTLKELARLSADLSPTGADARDRLTELVEHAAVAVRQTSRDHDDDLADPYGGPLAGYTAMMREADVASRAIAAALTVRSER